MCQSMFNNQMPKEEVFDLYQKEKYNQTSRAPFWNNLKPKRRATSPDREDQNQDQQGKFFRKVRVNKNKNNAKERKRGVKQDYESDIRDTQQIHRKRPTLHRHTPMPSSFNDPLDMFREPNPTPNSQYDDSKATLSGRKRPALEMGSEVSKDTLPKPYDEAQNQGMGRTTDSEHSYHNKTNKHQSPSDPTKHKMNVNESERPRIHRSPKWKETGRKMKHGSSQDTEHKNLKPQGKFGPEDLQEYGEVQDFRVSDSNWKFSKSGADRVPNRDKKGIIGEIRNDGRRASKKSNPRGSWKEGKQEKGRYVPSYLANSKRGAMGADSNAVGMANQDRNKLESQTGTDKMLSQRGIKQQAPGNLYKNNMPRSSHRVIAGYDNLMKNESKVIRRDGKHFEAFIPNNKTTASNTQNKNIFDVARPGKDSFNKKEFLPSRRLRASQELISFGQNFDQMKIKRKDSSLNFMKQNRPDCLNEVEGEQQDGPRKRQMTNSSQEYEYLRKDLRKDLVSHRPVSAIDTFQAGASHWRPETDTPKGYRSSFAKKTDPESSILHRSRLSSARLRTEDLFSKDLDEVDGLMNNSRRYKKSSYVFESNRQTRGSIFQSDQIQTSDQEDSFINRKLSSKIFKNISRKSGKINPGENFVDRKTLYNAGDKGEAWGPTVDTGINETFGQQENIYLARNERLRKISGYGSQKEYGIARKNSQVKGARHQWKKRDSGVRASGEIIKRPQSSFETSFREKRISNSKFVGKPSMGRITNKTSVFVHNQERAPEFTPSPFDGQYQSTPDERGFQEYSKRSEKTYEKTYRHEEPAEWEVKGQMRNDERGYADRQQSGSSNTQKVGRSRQSLFDPESLTSALAKHSILQMDEVELRQIFLMLDIKELGYLNMNNFGYYKLPQHLMIQMSSIAKQIFGSSQGIRFEEFVEKLDL